ncbi:FAD-dependent oxidoreductase [Candidatus Parcubacteria bacterium]|nr:MAG: FAD-dependent oxidoreductase [Candidatus Parcubacteria bacterium]
MWSGKWAFICLISLCIATFPVLPVLGDDNVYEVIVVGAGISGLSAADTLTQLGHEVVVLEARDRIGGRIWTDNSTHLDKGASWIHGIKYNPIFVLTEKYDIKTIPTVSDTNQKSHVYYDSDGKRMDESKRKSIDAKFADFQEFLAKNTYYPEHPVKELFIDQFFLYSIDSDKSIQDVLDKYVEGKNLSPKDKDDLKAELEHASNYYYVNTWAADITDISARHYSLGMEYGGGEVVFPGGYVQLVNKFSDELDIRLNHVVNKIDYSKSNEILVYVDGKSEPFKAKYVLVTLPLGVLKDSVSPSPQLLNSTKGVVKFIPPLPQEKVDSINNLEMGIMNKVYLIFENVTFLKQDADYQYISIMNEEKGAWSFFLNLNKSLGVPALLAFNSGDFGKKIEQLDFKQSLQDSDNPGYSESLRELDSVEQERYESAVIDLAIKNLRHIYGNEVPYPEKKLVTRWVSDPYSRGSYSYPAVDSTPKDYENLAKSVPWYSARLFFAGEATDPDNWGTVQGGYFSGIKAANDIDFWYNWHNGWESWAFTFLGMTVGIGIAWGVYAYRRYETNLATELLGRTREIPWFMTLLIAFTAIFAMVMYYWLEYVVGIIPDFFDLFTTSDDECYAIYRLIDTIPYLKLSPQEEAAFYQQYERCINA